MKAAAARAAFGVEAEAPELAAELARLTRESWTLFGNRGFARVDFRVTEDGPSR